MSYFKTMEITDDYDNKAKCTQSKELRTASTYRLVGTLFGPGTTVDTSFWLMSNSNSASITQATGEITLDTNTAAANGESVLISIRKARAIAGTSHCFKCIAKFNNVGATGNIRTIGCYDGSDGAFYELNGTTLNACVSKNGSVTRTASTSWNISTTTPTLTNYSVWEIYYNATKVVFAINDDLKHSIDITDGTSTWTGMYTLPARLSSKNSGGLQTSNTLTSTVCSILRQGNEKSSPQYKHISGAGSTSCKMGSGTLHSIVVNSPGTLCTIYDDTSAVAANIVGIIDISKTTGIVSQATYDLPFNNGLFIVTTGSGDITVIFE